MTKEEKKVRYYTGVGARKTPLEILELITSIAKALSRSGFVMRSGGAEGADVAFSDGAGKSKQIFLPWKGFRQHNTDNLLVFDDIKEEAFTIASRHHPAWNNLSYPAKSLMARNTHQILGPNLNDPSEFLVCWTPDGCYSSKTRTIVTGGTGQAISVACEFGVPVFNLRNQKHYEFMKKIVSGQIKI